MIYKLTKFVEWPTELPEGQGFEICVGGRSPVAPFLQALEGREVQGHPIVVRNLEDGQGIEGCRLLFLGPAPVGRTRDLVATGSWSILTTGDQPGFAEDGGMVEFGRDNGRVSLVINLGAVSRAGLQIAAPLLDLARVIRE